MTRGLSFPEGDFWQLRLQQVSEAYKNCTLCPHECGVNRFESHSGRCGLGSESHIYKEFLHWGEEPILSPSYTVYLTGCSMRCVFCSEWKPVTQPLKHGEQLVPDELAQRITEAHQNGARTVNFVGGDPGVNMLPVLRTLQSIPKELTVVWNTNLYASKQAIEWLGEHVDIWLVDFKFGSKACSQRLSGRKDYLQRIKEGMHVLGEMSAQVMVRHLLMPGHHECCTRPVLQWLSDNYPKIPVNVMSNFLPLGSPKSPLKSLNNTNEEIHLRDILNEDVHAHWLLNGQPFFRNSAATV